MSYESVFNVPLWLSILFLKKMLNHLREQISKGQFCDRHCVDSTTTGQTLVQEGKMDKETILLEIFTAVPPPVNHSWGGGAQRKKSCFLKQQMKEFSSSTSIHKNIAANFSGHLASEEQVLRQKSLKQLLEQ